MARDITKLHPYMQEKATKLVTECKKQGLIIKITDCVRTKEEQNGIDASRTNAKYPKSYHNWGLAFDFCRNDGKGAYYDNDGFFTKVGRIGQSMGLQWGGECFGKTLIDKPHFHTVKFGTYVKLINWYNDPSAYFKCWTIKNPILPITKISTKEHIMWLQYRLNEINNVGLIVDGSYGPKTAQAVLTYQNSKGWSTKGATGFYVGINTIKSLT